MAGESACLWSSWFRANHQHYHKMPASLDLAQWNIEHTRLLSDTREALLCCGAALRVESQNGFQFGHRSGAVLAGKPDLVAIEDATVTVVDCKTGRPKTSDRVQVMIYMFVLPYCFPELAVYRIKGKVVYRGEEIDVPAASADHRFGENLDYFLDRLATEIPPVSVPSVSECRLCDITKQDCRVRSGG
jgi:hypothetical protein